jgi:hypothetical protein
MPACAVAFAEPHDPDIFVACSSSIVAGPDPTVF